MSPEGEQEALKIKLAPAPEANPLLEADAAARQESMALAGLQSIMRIMNRNEGTFDDKAQLSYGGMEILHVLERNIVHADAKRVDDLVSSLKGNQEQGAIAHILESDLSQLGIPAHWIDGTLSLTTPGGLDVTFGDGASVVSKQLAIESIAEAAVERNRLRGR